MASFCPWRGMNFFWIKTNLFLEGARAYVIIGFKAIFPACSQPKIKKNLKSQGVSTNLPNFQIFLRLLKLFFSKYFCENAWALKLCEDNNGFNNDLK